LITTDMSSKLLILNIRQISNYLGLLVEFMLSLLQNVSAKFRIMVDFV